MDFNIELVRTDKINVVYILNLLKDINRKDKDEMTKSVDLILREIERSDNEKMRYKRDIMKAFVTERFFELDPDADIIEAYNEYEREALQADIAVSVTGLAGPGGDEFGNPVGRVYIGYADDKISTAVEFTFSGNRDAVRRQAAEEALKLVLSHN